MRYRIETAPDGAKLEEIVNRLLKKGWKLQGGVSVSDGWEPADQPINQRYSQIFAQALIHFADLPLQKSEKRDDARESHGPGEQEKKE